MHYDNLNLIVQSDGNAGDTCQREGWAWFGAWVRKSVLAKPWEIELPLPFDKTIELLEIEKSGNFRRHPTQSPWNDPWHEPGIFTRDQQIPLVAALGVWNLQEPLTRMWNNLTPSPFGLGIKVIQGFDIAGFDHLNLFRRARNEQPDQLGDNHLATAVATRLTELSIINKLNGKDTMDDVDDLNFIVNLLMAKLRSPSNIVEKAITGYSKNREMSYGCFLGHYCQTYAGDVSADFDTMKHRISQRYR